MRPVPAAEPDDLQRPVLFHPVLGVGPRGLDRERMVEYPTLARKAVARKLEREMMAEELRLLYVAMTRAKEKLILSIPLRRGAEELEKLGGGPVCSTLPHGVGAPAERGRLGAASRPGPARRPPCGAWRGCRRYPRGLWGPPGIFDG